MKLFSILLLFLTSCASSTQTNYTESPHDPDHVTKAYATSSTSNTPANEGDATLAVGSALINTALLSGKNASNKKRIAESTISGECIIMSKDHAALPCSSMLLILKKKNGTQDIQLRTSENGSFSYIANKGEEFTIETQSQQYVVKMEPSKPVKTGSSVKLILRQK